MLDDGTLLESPTRASLVRLVADEPGLSYTDLFVRLRQTPRAQSLGNGTLSWHLYKLEKSGLISSHRSGRARRFFPKAGPWHADLDGYSLLLVPSLRRLARRICAAGEATCIGLALGDATNPPRSRQATSVALKRLTAAGLVAFSRRGRHHVFRPTPRLLQLFQARRRAAPDPSLNVARCGRPFSSNTAPSGPPHPGAPPGSGSLSYPASNAQTVGGKP